MAQVQEVWNKLNSRERLAATGALIILLAWVVGLVGYGIGAGTISLLGAVAVLAIYYLKYSPNQTMTWPAPIPTIVLGISAVVALLAAIDLLQWLRFFGSFSLFGISIVAVVLAAVGAALMAWGAWQEYQATASTTSAASSVSTPAAPSAPAAPSTPPPTMSDTDDVPPA